MLYSEGVKYYLRRDEPFQLVDITLDGGRILRAPRGYKVDKKFITLSPDGLMLLKEGYPTDGPSGPTYDSRYCMRGAAGHDGGYELLRGGYIPPEFREYFDACLYVWVLEDGYKMIDHWDHPSLIKWAEKKWVKDRITLWYNGVLRCASFAADPKNEREIIDTEAY